MVMFGIAVESQTPGQATLEEMLMPCSNTGCHGGKLATCPLKECHFGKKASPVTLAAIAKTIELSHEAAAYCTTFFAAPNKLEFENVYWPYLLLDRKKRYAGPFWENAIAPAKRTPDTRGAVSPGELSGNTVLNPYPEEVIKRWLIKSSRNLSISFRPLKSLTSLKKPRE